MVTRAYFRCTGGEYFRTDVCPFDDWWSPESAELQQAAQRLVAEGERPTLDALRSAGVGPTVLDRTIVIEFGDVAAAFEALSPEGYVIEGRWHPTRKLGPHYHRVLG